MDLGVHGGPGSNPPTDTQVWLDCNDPQVRGCNQKGLSLVEILFNFLFYFKYRHFYFHNVYFNKQVKTDVLGKWACLFSIFKKSLEHHP